MHVPFSDLEKFKMDYSNCIFLCIQKLVFVLKLYANKKKELFLHTILHIFYFLLYRVSA